jgi:dihydroorotate dehydrogenase electron transfer subunit
MSVTVPARFSDVVPGQFVMLHTGARYPLLPRPISIHDSYKRGRTRHVDLLFQEVGEGTRSLAALSKGGKVRMWGPIGKGFVPDLSGPQILVAGGRGMAPLWFLARKLSLAAKGLVPMTLFYGARTSDELHYVDEFRGLGVRVYLATDDGSKGHKGFVTTLVKDRLEPAAEPVQPAVRGDGQLPIFHDQPVTGEVTLPGRVESPPVFYTCGPERMMEGVHETALRLGAACQVSMEAYMACGMGVCLGCACEGADGGMLHVCKDGPVMDSRLVFGGGK